MSTKAPTNKYNLSNPLDKDGNVRKYVKYVQKLADGTEKSKKEILEDMGVDTSKIVIRGFANKPLTIMKEKEILKYNTANKKWSIGKNGAKYLEEINLQIQEFKAKN